MSKLRKQLTTLAKQGGGSFKTVADRLKLASRIADRMAKLNIQIRDVKHIKTNHIELYIKNRQEEGISKRTLQNEMAGIRNILAVAGRTKLASPQHEKLSNHVLGLSNASRDGTKVAISEERYLSVFHHVEKQDMGVAMTMQLARYFGLRNVARNTGLTGKYSPHSLRYAWAVNAMDYHKNNGMNDDEAKVMVSMDLGHGDGRGRYVERVYNKLEMSN